jgi:cysteine desulfuration protein SufE
MSLASQTPVTAIDKALSRLEEDMEALGDWEERYRYLIELGRTLEPLPEAERSEANRVKGCSSQVWLVSRRREDGRLLFRGDSDAHIVRGLVAVLVDLYSDREPEEILAFDAEAGFARLGLSGALSRQRSNGLASMVQRIRRDAAG